MKLGWWETLESMSKHLNQTQTEKKSHIICHRSHVIHHRSHVIVLFTRDCTFHWLFQLPIVSLVLETCFLGSIITQHSEMNIQQLQIRHVAIGHLWQKHWKSLCFVFGSVLLEWLFLTPSFSLNTSSISGYRRGARCTLLPISHIPAWAVIAISKLLNTRHQTQQMTIPSTWSTIHQCKTKTPVVCDFCWPKAR